MGTCAAQFCSSDIIKQKKMQKYMMPEKRPLNLSRPSKEGEFDPLHEFTEFTPALEPLQSLILDEKTVTLLTNMELIGPATPIADEPKITDEPPVAQQISQQSIVPTPATPEPAQSELETDLLSALDVKNPTMETDESFEFHEIEKNVTSYRVKQLADVVDPAELEQILREQYRDNVEDDEDEDDSCSSSSSELSSEERIEIERRKSGQKLYVTKDSTPPMLYRDHTHSTWNDDQVDELHKDMEQQLASLTEFEYKVGSVSVDDQNATFTRFNSASSSIHRDHIGLFRNQSAASWNDEQISEAEHEMKKAMMGLLIEKRHSISSKSISSKK